MTGERTLGRLRALGLGIATGLLLVQPSAAEVDVGVRMGAGHSDNINRVSADEVDETIGLVGLNLLWRESRRRVDADVDLDLSYLEYLDDTFDGEVTGSANASLLLGVVPERLTWAFEDSFGQLQTDPFAPATPETRENVNYFTTGPDLMLRFGSAAFGRLSGRYSTTEYEESPLDGDRTSVAVALGRQLSARSDVTLNGVTERIRFDEAALADYDRDSLYASYETDGARTDISLDLGYSWLDRQSGEGSDGALVRLGVSRNVSASSVVSLSAGTQLTDAGDAARSAVGAGLGGATGVTATADPFENRFASVGWNFNRRRTALSVSASWNADRYEQQTTLDRTRWLYEIRLDRSVRPTLDLGLVASRTDEEFEANGAEAEETGLGATLEWRLGRSLGLTLLAERHDRDASGGLGEFTENRAFLTLTYRPLRAAQ